MLAAGFPPPTLTQSRFEWKTRFSTECVSRSASSPGPRNGLPYHCPHTTYLLPESTPVVPVPHATCPAAKPSPPTTCSFPIMSSVVRTITTCRGDSHTCSSLSPLLGKLNFALLIYLSTSEIYVANTTSSSPIRCCCVRFWTASWSDNPSS